MTTDDVRVVDSWSRRYTGSAVPGASVVVVQNGHGRGATRVWDGRSRARHRGNPETDYRLASVSKQFTAMAIMLLAKEGKLRYDQPIRDFWPSCRPPRRPSPCATCSITHRDCGTTRP